MYEEIDQILSGENEEVVAAHKEIIAQQKGEGDIILTGSSHLDYFLIGGLNNKMVAKGGRPSMGKTHDCEVTIDNLLDRTINPGEIAILRLNLEMQTKSLLLRDLKRTLGKKVRDIMSKPYTEEEKPIVTKVVNKHRDSRIINFSKQVSGDELRYLIRKFLDNVNAKDVVRKIREMGEYWAKNGNYEGYTFNPTKKIMLVDHIHIYQTKKEIDDFLSICNEFKLLDPNLSFIIYFQLNRTLEDVWRDTKDKKANPKTFLPNSSHIYNTDSLMQFADIIIGMVIPQVVDMEEYASVYKDRNPHLQEHFVSDDSDNTTARLKGRNRIYYNYIKNRLVDDFEDPRLYCSILNPEFEATAEKLYQESKENGVKAIDDLVFTTPKPETMPPVEPNYDMNNAFGKAWSIQDMTKPDEKDKPF